MKLSLEWLNDFVDLKDFSILQIIEKINLSICEVNQVEEYLEHIEDIIITQITKIKKHPNADRLVICEVFDGSNSYQIVTGATNLKETDFVPLAKVGTFVMGKKILKSKLREVESNGMLCSEKECGLSENHEGIMVLDKATKKDLGKSCRDFLGLRDKILHIDNKSITHRPDLWSHFGFARELSAQLGKKIIFSPLHDEFEFLPSQTKCQVIENQHAHSYYACLIENLKVTESNDKIKNRLVKCGVRAINNLVDITNYVLLEIGQPTHFFDANLLENIILKVEFGKKQEKIELLDDSLQTLDKDILLIYNENQPVALAGVMGGKKTAIHEQSTQVIMESAVFKREDIRKSIQKTSIRSESSIRYEKGLDSHTSIPTIKRALNLLKENFCPNLIAFFPQGFDNNKDKKVKIKSHFSFLNRRLGKNFEKNEILSILQKLHFKIIDNKDDCFTVQVPNFRHNYDITIEEDLIEEIGRTFGYDNLPISPFLSLAQTPIKNDDRVIERRIKLFFSSLNYREIYSYSFVSEQDNFIENTDKNTIKIQNTMPESMAYLRVSLYPSLFKSIHLNLDRFDEMKIYEIGRIYSQEIDTREETWLAFTHVLDIRANDKNLEQVENSFIEERTQFESFFDFFYLKNWKVNPLNQSHIFHPNCGLRFEIENLQIAEIGLVHPKHLDSYQINKRVIAGKIDLKNLKKCIKDKSKITFQVPSLYPKSKLDICFMLTKEQKTNTYLEWVKKENISEIREMFLKEIYTGKNIEKSKKAILYRFHLLDYNKNLTQERIKKITDQLVDIGERNGLKLRR